jgi:hypothetical protein
MNAEHELIERLTNLVAERMCDTENGLYYWADLMSRSDERALTSRRWWARHAVSALSLLAPMLVERDEEIARLRSQADTPASETSSPTGRTLKVTWHPNAVRGAIERAAAVTTAAGVDTEDVYEFRGGRLSWMDLACLLDAARALSALGGGGPDAA